MPLVTDVQTVCPVCGPVSDPWTIGESRFCQRCLAKFLRYGGVPLVVMKRVDHEDARSAPSDRVEVYICPKCGTEWPTKHGTSCPACGAGATGERS